MEDKFTLRLDSTQIQAFSECPEMWNLAYRQHLVPAGAVEKEAMNAGTYGHAMLDVYYKSRAAGRSLDDSLDIANSYDPDKQTCECGHKLEDHSPTTSHGSFIFPCIKDCECLDFKSKPFALSSEMRFTVRGRVRDHIFKYRTNDIIPHSPESVEVGFSEVIYEDDSNLFVLEGRIDVLGSIQGIDLVMDHKFQMRRRDLYKKSIQFRNYNLVSGASTLMVNYLRLTQKIDQTTLVRDCISFLPSETRWWKGQLINYFFRIKDELISHSSPTYDSTASNVEWTTIEPLRQEWGACSGKFGYPCSYTTLCEHTDPTLVQSIKSTQYTQKEAWSPWD